MCTLSFFFNNGLAGIFVVNLRHPNNDRVQIIQVNCYEPKLWHSLIKTSEKDLVVERRFCCCNIKSKLLHYTFFFARQTKSEVTFDISKKSTKATFGICKDFQIKVKSCQNQTDILFDDVRCISKTRKKVLE